MALALFRTKSLVKLLKDAGGTEGGLKKTLTASNLIALGIGAIIGTGIFVLTGTAAAQHAGPALVFSFILSGVGCAFAGLCYAEFASMIPVSGSAYTYSYATLGEFVAWIIGWDLILEYLFGAATVAVGWSGYVVSFLEHTLHIPMNARLVNAPFQYVAGQGWQSTGALINLPAVFIILLMTALLVVGIKESAKFNNVIVLVKVVVILAFIGLGAMYIDSANYEPFLPENNGTWGEYGWSGVLTGSAVIFFSYIGFDAVSTAAQEAKNPQRDMPIGMLGSLAVCTLLYVLVAAVLTGMVKYTELNVPAPVALAIDQTGNATLQTFFSPILKIGAIAGLSSVVLVMLMGQPRIFYSMANDGLLPASFAKLHPKYKTPYVTTILTGSVAAIAAGFLPIGELGHMVAIGTLLAFVIVCIGVIVLRNKRPDLHRPFKTPLVPLVPILGALICLAQMAALPLVTWVRLIVWMGIGIAIYFLYGARHSKLAKEVDEPASRY